LNCGLELCFNYDIAKAMRGANDFMSSNIDAKLFAFRGCSVVGGKVSFL